MELTVREIVDCCKGTLLSGDENTIIKNVSIDSRKTKEGDMFIALVGDNSDGHDYIESALSKGASAVLTHEHTKSDDNKHCWIKVQNTQDALQSLAECYRESFRKPIIGITGSVGKTTTKEMVALALSSELNVHKTKGNNNSQIGLPLTILGISPENDAAVIEMGMSMPGEMKRLAEIAKPNLAVITNIGIAHVENLGSRENIRSEKMHIIDFFNKNSVLFINGDDPMLARLIGFIPCKVLVYGTDYTAQYRAVKIKTEGNETRYTLRTPFGVKKEVVLPTIGNHNILNSLASIAVADYLGLDIDKVIEKLLEFTPPSMRQEIKEVNGITIIDDTYNASPDSIKSGLDILSKLDCKGRRIAVLADMLELGDMSEQAHFEVGKDVAAAGVDVLVTVGKRAKSIAKGAMSKNKTILISSQSDNKSASSYLCNKVKPGDCVIVKGSRGMKTDEIVRELIHYNMSLEDKNKK